MSMRPIDLQAFVPRSYEINRNNSFEANRPEIQQQQFVKQLNKEVKHDEQYVKESTKAEKRTRINEENKNKNKERQQKQQKQNEANKNKAAKDALEAYKSMSMVDIKV